MFALFAFGSLFGFVGLLLAVPLAAAVGVLARFALRQYLASPLYHGGRPRRCRPQPTASSRSRCLRRRSQLALDLPLEPRLRRARISSSAPRTRRAYARSRAGRTGPTPCCCSSARPAAARAICAAIWAARATPGRSTPSRSRPDQVPHLVSNGALVIEDATAPSGDEAALFHLLNLARERRAFVLLTRATPPDDWGIAHARTCCRACASRRASSLGAPDDALAAGGAGEAVRRPAARRRHLASSIISPLRIERSLAAAAETSWRRSTARP